MGRARWASLAQESPAPRGKRARLGVAVAVVGFVVAGLVVEVIFLPRASSAGGPKPSEAADIAFDQWSSDLKSRNVTGLAGFYAINATITYTGNAPSLTGTYNGIANIKILYGSTIGKFTFLNASVSSFTQKEITPLDDNMTFILNMKGNNTESGAVTIQANASQDWDYTGGHWQIVNETWKYTTFDEQFVCCDTTFPQWTAVREGLNPNLVSDKSFEWHAGPYVAASVYAFLGGVVAIGLVANGKGKNQAS